MRDFIYGYICGLVAIFVLISLTIFGGGIANYFAQGPSAPFIKFGDDSSLLIHAVEFAARAHAQQKRDYSDIIPYFNHLIGVAEILIGEANIRDTTVLAAALLHDTIEKTNTTLDTLANQFGADIANLVAQCTDNNKQIKTETPHPFRKAKLILLADKLDNLRFVEINQPVELSESQYYAYFVSNKNLVNELRGTNAALDDALDTIISRNTNTSKPK